MKLRAITCAGVVALAGTTLNAQNVSNAVQLGGERAAGAVMQPGVQRTVDAIRGSADGRFRSTNNALRGTQGRVFNNARGANYRMQSQPAYQYQQNNVYSQGSYAQGSMNAGYADTSRVYTLQHDASGREFICVNGQRVYFDQSSQSQGQMQNQTAGQNQQSDRYQSGYGSYDDADQGQAGQDQLNQNQLNQNQLNQNGIDQPALQDDNDELRSDVDAQQNLDADVDADQNSLQADGEIDARSNSNIQGNRGGERNLDNQSGLNSDLNTQGDVDAQGNLNTQDNLNTQGNLDAQSDLNTRGNADADNRSINTQQDAAAEAEGNLDTGNFQDESNDAGSLDAEIDAEADTDLDTNL